jgi:hypothetical protein
MKEVKKHDWYDCIWKLECRDINGNIKWKEEGRNGLVDEGEENMLRTYFRNESEPTEFYVRLANDTIIETDTLSDIAGEPSGNGYAPILIERSAVGFPIIQLDNGDYRVTSKEFTYTASGGTIGPVNLAYVATTSDNSGKLIAFKALSTTRNISDGDSLLGTFRIKLQ